MWTYSSVFWIQTSQGAQVKARGWYGEHGQQMSAGNIYTYSTSRIDLSTSPTVSTSLDITYKQNGSNLQLSYWNNPAAQNMLQPVVCMPSAVLPTAYAGMSAVNLDWLRGESGVGGIINLGNETLTLSYPDGSNSTVIAEHWQAPAACRDMWLTALPSANGPGDGKSYMQPVLYSLASNPPSCDTGNFTFLYINTIFLASAPAAQGSDLFLGAVPPACAAAAAAAAGGSQGLGNPASGTVATVWLIVASCLCFVLGAGGGLLLGIYRVRQWASGRYRKVNGTILTQRLVDGF